MVCPNQAARRLSETPRCSSSELTEWRAVVQQDLRQARHRGQPGELIRVPLGIERLADLVSSQVTGVDLGRVGSARGGLLGCLELVKGFERGGQRLEERQHAG